MCTVGNVSAADGHGVCGYSLEVPGPFAIWVPPLYPGVWHAAHPSAGDQTWAG